MATVNLYWEASSIIGSRLHRCELAARKDGDSLVMEAHDRGGAVVRQFSVSAYYTLDYSVRIPLYDDEGFSDLDDAKEALAQWYLENAPTLLVTLTA